MKKNVLPEKFLKKVELLHYDKDLFIYTYIIVDTNKRTTGIFGNFIE